MSNIHDKQAEFDGIKEEIKTLLKEKGMVTEAGLAFLNPDPREVAMEKSLLSYVVHYGTVLFASHSRRQRFASSEAKCAYRLTMA